MEKNTRLDRNFDRYMKLVNAMNTKDGTGKSKTPIATDVRVGDKTSAVKGTLTASAYGMNFTPPETSARDFGKIRKEVMQTFPYTTYSMRFDKASREWKEESTSNTGTSLLEIANLSGFFTDLSVDRNNMEIAIRHPFTTKKGKSKKLISAKDKNKPIAKEVNTNETFLPSIVLSMPSLFQVCSCPQTSVGPHHHPPVPEESVC